MAWAKILTRALGGPLNHAPGFTLLAISWRVVLGFSFVSNLVRSVNCGYSFVVDHGFYAVGLVWRGLPLRVVFI